jgi:hypothetical protein
MYEIVNKGLHNLNGVYSGVARHIWCQKWDQWRNTSQYIYIYISIYLWLYSPSLDLCSFAVS